MRYILLCFTFCSILLSSCTVQKKTAVAIEKNARIELVFIPMVGDNAFYPDSTYTTPGGETYTLRALKFFLSDIAFSRSNTPEMPALSDRSANGVYLVDFSEAQTDSVTGRLSHTTAFTVAQGNYSDIRFTMGIPRTLNHADPTMAPYPLDLGQRDMFWEWNSGYIFLLLEGHSIVAEDSILHLAIGGDSRIMPFAFGDLFNAVPLIQVKENTCTRIHFSFDLNKVFINGDGTYYSFQPEDAALVHGGYQADLLRLNVLNAVEFMYAECIPLK